MHADAANSLVRRLSNTFSYPVTNTMSMLRGGCSAGFHQLQLGRCKGKSHVKLLADGSRFFVIVLGIAIMFAPLRAARVLADRDGYQRRRRCVASGRRGCDRLRVARSAAWRIVRPRYRQPSGGKGVVSELPQHQVPLELALLNVRRELLIRVPVVQQR